MVSDPSISVVICVYSLDRLESITAGIGSVASQTRPPLEIIVVCDHNEELLAEVRVRFASVIALENAHAKGLSGARNSGVERATGEIVAFLDDDAFAEPDWLERLAESYSSSAVMAVGGDIAPVWLAGRPQWWPEEFNWVIGCSYRGLPSSRRPVRNLIGCNMSMRRDALLELGGFREGLGRDGDDASGCEETELFIRARAAFPDREVIHDPAARVHHMISPSRTRWDYFAARCRAEGRSKADVVQRVGGQAGLAAERAYTRRVLPAGVWRGIRDAFRRDFSGVRRSAVIIAGLALVSSSFCHARLRKALNARPAPAPFKPVLIVDADLANGLPDLPAIDPDTGVFRERAWCLVRSAGQPVKILELALGKGGIDSDRFAQIIRNDPAPMPPAPIAACKPSHAPHVSVVIATRDRADSLGRCIESLLAQTYSDFDIVVVDNAPSSQVTADLVTRAFAYVPNLQYVREDIPGLGRAHNRGLGLATGEVVAFTDDDVVADPAWIERIAANFLLSDQIGCVTGLIVPIELETRAQYWTERHGGFGKGLARRVYDSGENRPADPLFPFTAGQFGSGANMAFCRAALTRIGGFDDALGAGTPARGGDDLASFADVIEAGYQLVFEPGAIVWHQHRRSEDGMRRQAFGYGVGLGAYLTRQLITKPSRLLAFARRLPAACRHMFGASSQKMARLPSDYPRSLVWRERLGIIMGVPSYLRSRHVTRGSMASRTPDAGVLANTASPRK